MSEKVGADPFGLPPVRDEAWHQARAKVVGGSEVAALFGCQPDYALSHYALWMVKAGRVPAPEVNGERPKWGLRLERTIAEAAAEQEGWTVEPRGWVQHPSIAGMGCTLDYIITAGEPHREDHPGVLELKNADWLQHRRTWTDNEPPLHILLQLQHQLACTGAAWGAVACLIGGNALKVYRYEARAKLIADIERRVIAFWQSIREGKPPPVDASATTGHVLNSMFPDAAADELDLRSDNELPELCANLLHAAADRRKAEKVEDQARHAILAKVGPHARALTEGFAISAPAIAAIPERVITLAEVGQKVKGRAGYRRLTVKEFT